jgi:hypothetical protein
LRAGLHGRNYHPIIRHPHSHGTREPFEDGSSSSLFWSSFLGRPTIWRTMGLEKESTRRQTCPGLGPTQGIATHAAQSISQLPRAAADVCVMLVQPWRRTVHHPSAPKEKPPVSVPSSGVRRPWTNQLLVGSVQVFQTHADGRCTMVSPVNLLVMLISMHVRHDRRQKATIITFMRGCQHNVKVTLQPSLPPVPRSNLIKGQAGSRDHLVKVGAPRLAAGQA